MSLPGSTDVLIIGAGPAGLAAAAELATRGHAVLVIERENTPGGIPRHCGHSPYGWREFRRIMGGQAYARALTDRATRAGAEIHTQTTVTALKPGGDVHLSNGDGAQRVQARAVLLATGARETSRAARFIGGTKPGGVLNTGALQGLVYLRKARPFKRPVILGTELVSFSALLTCRHAGARPVAMLDHGPRVVTHRIFEALPRLLRVPLHFNTEITTIHGSSWVEGITLRREGQTQHIDCDGVVITGGFRPENALLRASHLTVDPGTRGPEVDQFGRCSDPAYFAAGNVLRPVETAPWCWAEGRHVAAAMDTALQGGLPEAQTAEPIRTPNGTPLSWHMPQRIVPDSTAPAALERLQIGLTRQFQGRLRYGDTDIPLRSRPERRTLLPLPKQGTQVVAEEQT